ncbi:ribonuclease H-like domain-containing protein [Tanacetum coccineum]
MGKTEVIKNGNKVLKRTVGEIEQEYEPTTAEEKQDKRNEMKARGTLLMALPNKDQLKFHSYKDSKLLMEAIEKRNKHEIETISLDDLYNNLKIYEPEISGSSSSYKSKSTINWLFVSSNSTNSNSNTNEADNTAYGVSAAHTQSNPKSGDKLSNAEIAMLNVRARRFIRGWMTLDGNVKGVGFGYDMSKVECYNCHKNGHFAREYRCGGSLPVQIHRWILVSKSKCKSLCHSQRNNYDNVFQKMRPQASDEELEELMKDQLLPADASPIALSSGYISDSDPEEDPADYPADGGDNDDNESSDDDDDDYDVERMRRTKRRRSI